jgi:uncharacterized protein
MNLKPILNVVLDQYRLPLNDLHGVVHWARVLENGLRLCEETGGDLEVVSLFAILHDSQRQNEGYDPDHGPRAAEFARELRGTVFELEDRQFRRLYSACEGHTHELTHEDITIQTCWDADRLDLGRIGIVLHPSRLCTDVAKRKGFIDWVYGRGCMEFVPERVSEEWGIELGERW